MGRRSTCMTQPRMKMTKPRETAVPDLPTKVASMNATEDMAMLNSQKVRNRRPKLLCRNRSN